MSAPIALRWSLSAHARRLLTLAVAGLLAAIITRRPEFAGVAAPAVLLLTCRRPRRPAAITVDVSTTARQLVEGDQADVLVRVGGQGSYLVSARVEPGWAFSARPVERGGRQAAARTSLRIPFTAQRWGIHRVGRLEVILRDRLRLTEGRAWLDLPRIGCHPRPAPMRGRVVLSRLPARLGEHPARAAGEGTEFIGIRGFVPGDRQRRINWAATTRLGTVQLNTFAAERTQNVVVLADATTNVGEPGATTLDLAFRAAAGTITCYLSAGERVGLIVYAERLSWIGPGQGRRHLHRLMDLLLSTERGQDRAGGLARMDGLARMPRAALPPGALILVFSPLLHPRLIESLRDLRERGFSVLVIDVLSAAPPILRDRTGSLAWRIWLLEQQAIRFSLTELGIPVAAWDGVQPLDETLAPYTRRVMVAGRR